MSHCGALINTALTPFVCDLAFARPQATDKSPQPCLYVRLGSHRHRCSHRLKYGRSQCHRRNPPFPSPICHCVRASLQDSTATVTPATTPPADAATIATLRLHFTNALRHGLHLEVSSPFCQFSLFADSLAQVNLATTTDCRSVSPTFRHGVTDCYVPLQSKAPLRSPIHCATFPTQRAFPVSLFASSLPSFLRTLLWSLRHKSFVLNFSTLQCFQSCVRLGTHELLRTICIISSTASYS